MRKNIVFSLAVAILFCGCNNMWFSNAAKIYEVEFETNGGSTVDSVQTYKIKTMPVTSKINCDFLGWYESKTFSGTSVEFPYDVDDDVTLYAKWLQKYNVKFDTNGGNPETIDEMLTGTIEANSIQEPEKDGYTFDGWYVGNNNKVDFPYEVLGNVTLYAKYLKNYNITFDSQGGSSVEGIEDIAKLKEFPAPPTRTDYDFVGWYTTSTCSGEPIILPYTITKDTTLYAKWR